MTITGFGKTDTDQFNSNDLLSAKMDILPERFCYIHFKGYQADSTMCVGQLDKAIRSAICAGDSGGPLILGEVFNRNNVIQ